jgi:hypothetical protein
VSQPQLYLENFKNNIFRGIFMADKKDRYEQEELKEDSLESMLEEQSRNQVRSDYRRSLGSENRRRYME